MQRITSGNLSIQPSSPTSAVRKPDVDAPNARLATANAKDITAPGAKVSVLGVNPLSVDQAYTSETIQDNGKSYHVLDGSKLNFSAAPFGKKTAETTARLAEPEEHIVTMPGTEKESAYVANGGEVVFDNGGGDVYVPRDNAGHSTGKHILDTKYDLVRGSLEQGNAAYIPKANPSRIMPFSTTRYTAIKDAWGPGAHQFLPPNSTLKLNDNGQVTGIEGSAFEKTWSITDQEGNILPS